MSDDLVTRLRVLTTLRADFVTKREAMNVARPSINATKAERALYDERYRADYESERAFQNAAIAFGQWAGDTNAADRIEQLEAEVAKLRAERDSLAGIVQGWHYLAVGPDEMGDYYTHKQLVKASEPYASPGLRSIMKGHGHD